MTLVQCERCKRTAPLKEGNPAAKVTDDIMLTAKPDGWSRPSINFQRRDLCPDCSAVLKTVFEAFLANGQVPMPAVAKR